MIFWSENWMPLFSFRPELILMSHFKMEAEKHHDHTESNVVYVWTHWMLYSKLKVLPVCSRHLERWIFAVNSNSIYWVSCLPHPLNIRLQTYIAGMWATRIKLKLFSLFLSAIFISGLTATPSDVNIIAIKKSTLTIGAVFAILFLCALETKWPLNTEFLSLSSRVSIF